MLTNSPGQKATRQTLSPPQSTVQTIYRQSTKLSVHHKAPYKPFTASLPNSQSTTKHRTNHLPPVYQTLSPPQSTVRTIYRQSTKLSVHHKAPYKPFTASLPNTQSTTKHRTNHLPPVYQTLSPPQSTVQTIYRQSTKHSVHHKAPYKPFTASLPNSQSTTKHRTNHLPPVYQKTHLCRAAFGATHCTLINC